MENSRGERVPLTGISPDIKLADDFSKEIGSRNDPLMHEALIRLFGAGDCNDI